MIHADRAEPEKSVAGKNQNERARTALQIGFGSICLCSGLFAAACARYEYRPEPVEPDANLAHLLGRSIDEPQFVEFLSAHGPVTALPPAAWDAELLTLATFYFNPRLRAARAALDLRRAELVTASQRANPDIEIPLEHHSDTSGGRSPWLAGLITDWRFERRGKRDARIERVQALAEVAWIELEATAWGLRSQLHQAMIDFRGAAVERELIEHELKLSERSQALLARRAEMGEAGTFELNRARLQLQRLKVQQVSQEVLLDDRRRALVGLTGLPEAQLEGAELGHAALDALPGADRIEHLAIREVGLTHRFDIRKALADYAAAEALLKLEIEKQHPDIILSPGFVFDQDDEIWTLGAAWALPVFHRNDGPIREALAQRDLEQARILSLQWDIINDIERRRGFYLAQIRALSEAEELVDQADRSEAQLRRQFDLGHVDRLAVLEASLNTTRARRDALALRVETMKAAQALENALQSPLTSTIDVPGLVRALFFAEDSVAGLQQ